MSKNTDKTVEYLNTLAQENKLDDATKANLLKVFESEALAEALGGDVLRHADFSRNSDELRKEKDEFEGEKKLQKDWYGGAVTTFEANKAKSAELETSLSERDTQLKSYRDTYGDLQGADAPGPNGNNGAGDNPPFDASKYMTREDHEKALQARDVNTIGVIKGAYRLGMDHYTKFGTPLDMDAVEKIAVEKQLPMNAAYAEHIAPQVAEQQKTEHEKQMKEAKEEGRQEALRDHQVPTDNAPSLSHVFHDQAKPEDAPAGAGKDAFMEGIREQPGT